MFVDARSVPQGTSVEADICIVGAGAAGITLAKEFMSTPLRVCILESGNFDFETETQDLYVGQNVGYENFPLDASRLRYLGGTTNHWSGRCRPLDPLDFEARSWVPHSGWPITRADLDPYYRRAEPYCQLQPTSYELDDKEHVAGTPLPLDGHAVQTGLFQYSAPTRFGELYRTDLEQAQNVTVYLNANVLHIDTSDNGAQVTGLQVGCLNGNRLTVKARQYVLATGGIENARLLLASNQRETAGVGNRGDLVGRFFMEHPIHYSSGLALFENTTPDAQFYDKHLVGGGTFKAFLTPSAKVQEEQKLLNCGMDIQAFGPDEPGVASLKYLVSKVRKAEMPREMLVHISNVIGDIGTISEQAWHKVFPGKTAELGKRTFTLRYWAEPQPNPDSRVMLSDETDALGMPRTAVDWRMTDQDRRNIEAFHNLVGSELGRHGLGRVRFRVNDDDPHPFDEMEASNHHMGTTRMSADPSSGVVDINCCIHGMENLHVAGSSVFPTVGHANPTLTIVALAVRIADYLKYQMT